MAPVIIVTGGSRGIGLETTRRLLKDGARVVAVSRSTTPELEQLYTSYPSALHILQADIGKDEGNKTAVETALQKFGSLDGLVLNAGVIQPIQKLADVDINQAAALYQINVLSLFSILKHAIPSLRKSKGKVIFVSSGAAVHAYAAWSVYGSSKAALNSINEHLAVEEPDITSVALRVGVVDTGMQKDIRQHGVDNMTDSDYKKFSSLHSDGILLPPSVPGIILANLVLKADHSLSGTFCDYADEHIKPYTT